MGNLPPPKGCGGSGALRARTELETRASAPLSAVPRAFLRWAGSKRYLLPDLVEAIPEAFGTYREPFLGSGSLFFLLQPHRSVLSDAARELMSTYCAVREGADAVISHLRTLDPERATYYRIREERSKDPFHRAAEFIYLNRTGWNGLYRVNSQGKFNVPFGRPKSAQPIDERNLLACAKLLGSRGTSLLTADFETALEESAPGDLVFLDPPYVTNHNNNGFVDYNEKLFSWRDQQRLARIAVNLANKGVHVLVTNAHHREVTSMYLGFGVIPVERSSTLAASPGARRRVTEALLVSPSLEKAPVSA